MYRHLLQCFGRDRYELGTEVVGFEVGADEVRVAFGDGRATTVDLLVCAEGIGSTTRRRLLPDVAPVYAGYVGLAGHDPGEDLPSNYRSVFDDTIRYCVSPAATSYVPDTRRGRLDRAGQPPDELRLVLELPDGPELDDLFVESDGVQRPAARYRPGTSRNDQLDGCGADASP